MSTAPAKTDAPAQIPREPIEAGGEIAAIIPQSVDQAFRLAQALARAGDMVPKDFQGHPDKIMGAILRGAEIGLAPMQALSHIAVINGRATIWGDALPALMQRAGHTIDVEIVGSVERGDKQNPPDAVATATLTRGDTGKVIVRTFSVADAIRANLWGKTGPWQQYPQRMLAHRARAWAVRDGAADALMGLQVSEEVSDYQGPDNARDITPAPARRRSASLVLPEPTDPPDTGEPENAPSEPEIEPETVHEPEDEPDVDTIIEGHVIDDPAEGLPLELESAFTAIMGKLEDARTALDVAKVKDAFAAEIAAIRAASPAHGDKIDAGALREKM